MNASARNPIDERQQRTRALARELISAGVEKKWLSKWKEERGRADAIRLEQALPAMLASTHLPCSTAGRSYVLRAKQLRKAQTRWTGR